MSASPPAPLLHPGSAATLPPESLLPDSAAPWTLPPVALRLREATAAAHAGLEALVDVERRFARPGGYRDWLADLYGFHAPVEAALARLDWGGTGLDPAARRKGPLLAADLEGLGLPVESLPLCPDPPPIDNLYAGLGCLYVLEGAMLGGRTIGRQLDRLLGGDPRGRRYYTGYGSDTGRSWRAFLGALAVACGDGPEAAAREAAAREAACIAAANRAFAALGAWVTARDAARAEKDETGWRTTPST